MTLTGLSNQLTRMMDRPVIDQTGIEGQYDFALDFGADAPSMMRKAMGGLPPVGDGHAEAAAAAADPGQSIFTSIQTYGLKLEPRKAPVEMIVVDHAEKTPTEN